MCAVDGIIVYIHTKTQIELVQCLDTEHEHILNTEKRCESTPNALLLLIIAQSEHKRNIRGAVYLK
jgi:hypothetical protein